tara:strand:- start:666 stop:842 length:177 start_codon:yes stop_codon:yes gene_type:complete
MGTLPNKRSKASDQMETLHRETLIPMGTPTDQTAEPLTILRKEGWLTPALTLLCVFFN